MNICVFGASSTELDAAYLNSGELLGETMAKHGHGLVFGAGTNGMMGAVARGVHRIGGSIVGVVPRFFQVDGVLFPHCNELIYTNTMRERKQIMDDRADAFITMPGGIGTFEEFFEILTLRQLGQSQKPMVLFNQNDYYHDALAMLHTAVKQGFMKEASLSLCYVTDSVEDALNYVEHPMDLDGSIHAYKFLPTTQST